MDHSNHERLAIDELTSAILEGATIYGAHDAEIGKVAYMHGAGTPSLVVIDLGGGSAGSGSKRVAVPMSQLTFMRDEEGSVHAVTSWTQDQIEQMPEHHEI